MTAIYLDVEQGSRAWIEARLGIPTASNFKRLLTPAGKLSKSTGPYMAELLSEHYTGEPWSDFENEWTEWGKKHEDDARSWYEFETDCKEEIRSIGFVYRDEMRMVGGEPGRACGRRRVARSEVSDVQDSYPLAQLRRMPSRALHAMPGRVVGDGACVD